MRTFAYRGFDRAGRRAAGLVEADAPKEARERMAARGVLVETISAVDSSPRSSGRGSGWRRASVRSMVYREMAAMLAAGLPLTRAVELMIDTPELASCRSALAHARDRLREGASPSSALSDSGALTPLEVAALEAGQRAGALELSLTRLASYLETQEQAADRARSALLYPAFVAVFAVVVAVGLLGFLLPSFARIWSEARVELPWITRVMVAIARESVWALPALGAGLASATWMLRRRWRESPAFRVRMERRWSRWPALGPAWTALISARFARTFHMLLEGGVPLVEAMAMAGRATGSAWVERDVDRETEAVRHGMSPADALRRIPPLAATLAGWVDAGEASGSLPSMLSPAADRLQQIWERRLQRSVALIEPAVIILLGVLVLLIALAVILPILSLNRALA